LIVDMTDEAKSLIIRMAWEDRTTFEEIREKTGFSEREVIQLMRKSLKPGSFRESADEEESQAGKLSSVAEAGEWKGDKARGEVSRKSETTEAGQWAAAFERGRVDS